MIPRWYHGEHERALTEKCVVLCIMLAFIALWLIFG